MIYFNQMQRIFWLPLLFCLCPVACKTIGEPSSQLASSAPIFQSVRTLTGHTNAVHTMAFHPTVPYLAVSGGWDGRILGWDLRTGTKLWVFIHPSVFMRVLFSKDGTFVAAAGNRGGIVLLKAETGELVRIFEGHAGSIEALAMSPDGKFMATGSTDATIMLWNTQTGQDIHLWANRDGWVVKALDFSGDGRFIFAGAIETLRVWSVETKAKIREIGMGNWWIDDMHLSPDNRFVAITGDERNDVHIINTETGNVQATLHGHTDSVGAVKFSKDMRFLITGGRDGTIRTWNIVTGAETSQLAYDGFSLFYLALSGDNSIMLTTDFTEIKVWRADIP